jgi:hypothetical protein
MAPQLISAAGSVWQALSGGQPRRGRQRAPSRRKYLTRRNIGVGVAIGAVATAGYGLYRYQAGQSIGSSVGFAGSPASSVSGVAMAAPIGAPSGGYSGGGYTPTQQE